jgi:hypothetical protein
MLQREDPSPDPKGARDEIERLVRSLDMLATLAYLAAGADRNTISPGIARAGSREGKLDAAPDPASAYPLSTQDRTVALLAKRSLTSCE